MHVKSGTASPSEIAKSWQGTGKYPGVDIKISPRFTFEDFKNTSFYNNHDGIKSIRLKEKQTIDNKNYFVSFFFRNSNLYAITLMIADLSISEKDEANRKNLYDEILRLNGIESGKEYSWGKFVSEIAFISAALLILPLL